MLSAAFIYYYYYFFCLVTFFSAYLFSFVSQFLCLYFAFSSTSCHVSLLFLSKPSRMRAKFIAPYSSLAKKKRSSPIILLCYCASLFRSLILFKRNFVQFVKHLWLIAPLLNTNSIIELNVSEHFLVLFMLDKLIIIPMFARILSIVVEKLIWDGNILSPFPF